MEPFNFDPQDPAFITNPYPQYDMMREKAPIAYLPEWKMWLLTAHDDISALLREHQIGRAVHPGKPLIHEVPYDNPHFANLQSNTLLDIEPPDHTRIKSLVQRVFTPRAIENLRPHIVSMAGQLMDQALQRRRFDVLADLAVPLSVTVIGELLGIPPADWDKLRPWSRDIIAMFELKPTPADKERADQTVLEFTDYLTHLEEKRRQDPKDDLVSALVVEGLDTGQISHDEFIATCVLLLNAGHEATVNVLGNGTLAFIHNPDQLNLLRAHPELLKTAIEELLRYDTPLQMFTRWAMQDMYYKDVLFKQGDRIMLVYAAANRDPARFPNPNRLDITRQDNPHLGLGAGIHYCLGAPLARVELSAAFSALLGKTKSFTLACEPQFRPALSIRGLKELILEV